MRSMRIDIYEMTYGEYNAQNSDLYNEYAKHIYRMDGDIDIAIDYERKAVDFSLGCNIINARDQMEYCFVLGNLYIESNYAKEGIEYLKECIRIAEYNDFYNQDYIQALCALAQQYSIISSERGSAIQYIDKAIKAANKVGEHIDLCAAYYYTAVAYGNLGEYESALENLDFAEQEGILAQEDKFIELIQKYRDHVSDCMANRD